MRSQSKPLSVSLASAAEGPVEPVQTPPRRSWAAWQVHLLVIALYSLIVLAFTWPLPLHLSEQSLKGYDYVIKGVPFDRDQFIWDMWWVKKALLDFGVNPYHTNHLYYPYGVDLYLQSLTPVNGLLGIFLQGWLGWLGAYNMVLLIIFVWCGHAAFMLADYLLRDRVSAFVAGLFFTLAPQHYFNLHHAQLNVITLQFMPLYLLYLFKLERFKPDAPGDWQAYLKSKEWRRYTLLAVLFLVLCTVSDQYLLLFCLIITGLYWLWRGGPALWRHNWRTALHLPLTSLPALVGAGLVMLPFLYATWRTINSGLWAKIQNGAVPSDAVALFMPPVNNIFVGAQASELGRALPIQPDPRAYAIGLVGLAIAVYATLRIKEARWWGFLMVVSIVLALGQELQLRYQPTGIPLPGRWLNQLPVFEVMRYSKRWIGPASLAIAIAAGYALSLWLRRIAAGSGSRRVIRWKQGVLVLVVVGAFMLEAEPWPIALSGQEAALPKAYAQSVLPKTDRRALLELPFYQKYTAKANEMYWQTAHERPIVGGYISRVYKLDYNETPFAYFVDGYRPDQPDFLPVDPADLKSLLAYYDFGYIAIYKMKLAESEVARWRKTLSALLGPGTTPYYEDEQLVFYQLPDRASGLAGNPRPFVLRGTGWGGAERQPDGAYYRWLLEAEGTLPLFRPPSAPDSQKLQVQFEAAAYYRERTVVVRVNGQERTRLKIGPALQSYRLELASEWLKPGDNLLTFAPLEPADKPSDIEKSADTRPLTILLRNITLRVEN